MAEIISQEDKDAINHDFRDGVKYLEGMMGIHLSVLEKFKLRKLIEEFTQRAKGQTQPWSGIIPYREAVNLFLNQEYDVPLPYYGGPAWLIGRNRFIIENGYDGYKEFWQRKQAEKELI